MVAHLPLLLGSIFQLTQYYSSLHPIFEDLLVVPLPSVIASTLTARQLI